MASTTASRSSSNAAARRAELRTIPLSRIVVKDGFNPRGAIAEDDELQALAATMRERGCLQSIRVRATDSEEFELISGERRYRAAALAALTEIPALVLPQGAGDEAEQLELLSDAVIENELRSDLDPLQRARGYQAMIDCGLNVRGVAERLGASTKRSSREKRIREHLVILVLPQDLQAQLAAGEIPLMAVKALRELCELHEDLARAAVAATKGENEYDSCKWSELLENPLVIAVANMEELPDGIYVSGKRYPLEMFTLSEKASKDLAALLKIVGAEGTQEVCFTPELVEQARVLGAVHRVSSWSTLIAGQDVADQLAGDAVTDRLKRARAEQRRQREQQRANGGKLGSSGSSKGEEASTKSPDQRAEREAEEAKARREQERQEREKATSFNEALGLLCFKHLPKLRVEERVLRVLASVRLAGDIRGIATRGARLAFPGWIEQSAKGRQKNVYLDPHEVKHKASRFLAAAESAGEIAGRALTLIALASLVDERAIARSRGSFYTLTFSGPFARQAKRDLNAIVRERIKEGQLPELDETLAARLAIDKEDQALEAKQAKARLRLDGLRDHAQLTAKQLEQAIADAEFVHGQYSIQAADLRTEQARRSDGSAKAGDTAEAQKVAA